MSAPILQETFAFILYIFYSSPLCYIYIYVYVSNFFFCDTDLCRPPGGMDQMSFYEYLELIPHGTDGEGTLVKNYRKPPARATQFKNVTIVRDHINQTQTIIYNEI